MAEKGMSAIIQDIEDHIAGHGGIPSEWYVSVTDAPKHALFNVHMLKTSGDAWISRKAITEMQAIEVADYFRTVQKTRGTKLEASVGQVFVYAYRMKPHTKP